MFADRFDGQERLLLRALQSGLRGSQRALEVFHKQQRANPNNPVLQHFIETLCQEELTCSATKPLSVKPMMCLFPMLFKQNLLAFIHHIHHLLPQTTVCHMLECIKCDPLPDTWVTSLIVQLERQLNIDYERPLFTAQCGQRLMDLSQRLCGDSKDVGWAKYFQADPSNLVPEDNGLTSQELPQRKRKSSTLDLDSDSEETSQRSKRKRVDLLDGEDINTEVSIREEPSNTQARASTEPPPPDVPHDAFPESLKVAILQLRDLLESHAEWDQSSSDMFKVLNDCDPAQVEVVCSSINLPKIPEHILPKLCITILELSPDLSFSSATAFIKSLLLDKILSLSEPASRCLVTSVTSLCSRYPRPMCHALFEQVFTSKNTGTLQADLLNKLIEGCLDSHYKLLILQMTFKVEWTEAVLSVIHCLLDSKLDINEELFTHFTKQLLNQASQFAKSVKFAKMLLTVLTKYGSNVTAAHKHTLSDCLLLNETFLKKSLQAALKKIIHS